ncbi:conserved hypothetical protein [Pediculus humanus corporis]|uniref:EF-hand domain-containing protein n=1 Tax=Pediculus humanus subsp. corporis TaxID=121224 RepID=E0VLS7_PEDHC|nr:uncharacterized protein Phum_PHUM293230 [Pediculus humanus corporis]EEB14333.1 conserved hypothetical protein [Pediculus humanus corporis]
MILCIIMRALFAAGGFHWVKVKGKQATSKEAPVLAVAPHSSYFDALSVVYLGGPSVVAKGETGILPLFGKLINYTQPVYVWRDDHDSRQNTIKEIIERANSELDWPQVLIFPEGTCTNRSCLITFKSGAFYPGVPVQPVCIRYPNKLDTVTWTWEGPGVLKLLWLTLTQIHSCCEIEFLPVYKPNKEEKNDPRLFANNVRKVMARALGIPVSNYTYDDCKLMNRAKQMKLPYAGKLVEVQRLRQALGLTESNMEEKIIRSSNYKSIIKSPMMSYYQFTEALKLSPNNSLASQLFKLCDKKSIGVIDFRDYLLTVLVIAKNNNILDLLYLVFKVVDKGDNHIKESDFCIMVHRILSIETEQCLTLFKKIDVNCKGYISYDEFRDFAKKNKEFLSLTKSNNCIKGKSE